MKIDIVISDPKHPLRPVVQEWIAKQKKLRAKLLSDLGEADGGDALVLIACHQIVRPDIRGLYQRVYVTHASDLPKGRGWSPVVWGVLQGEKTITVSLIEAAEPVDSGRIYAKFRSRLKKTDLSDNINGRLAKLIVRCLNLVASNPSAKPQPQQGESTTYRRRRPDDSRVDPNQSIASQFDLLRVCDGERFPAFFELHGQRFELIIRKPPKKTGDGSR